MIYEAAKTPLVTLYFDAIRTHQEQIPSPNVPGVVAKFMGMAGAHVKD